MCRNVHRYLLMKTEKSLTTGQRPLKRALDTFGMPVAMATVRNRSCFLGDWGPAWLHCSRPLRLRLPDGLFIPSTHTHTVFFGELSPRSLRLPLLKMCRPFPARISLVLSYCTLFNYQFQNYVSVFLSHCLFEVFPRSPAPPIRSVRAVRQRGNSSIKARGVRDTSC